MTDHWQTIEDALNSERCTIVNMMDGWRNTSATYKRYVPELEAINAALAFVREQRAVQPSADIKQAILDMCSDWAQSDYENDAERAEAVEEWIKTLQ